MKINWSGRAHNFSNKDINYFIKIIKNADPLTQGIYLSKFEKDFSKFLGKKNVYAVSSAAAALEIIAILLRLKKNQTQLLRFCCVSVAFCNRCKIFFAKLKKKCEKKIFFSKNCSTQKTFFFFQKKFFHRFDHIIM